MSLREMFGLLQFVKSYKNEKKSTCFLYILMYKCERKWYNNFNYYSYQHNIILLDRLKNMCKR